MRGRPEFMRMAIQLATDNVVHGRGGPFGAVIVKDGAVIATGTNQVTASNDPTAHAEVMALRNACQALGTFQLAGCDLYTSCEPCPMCLAAIYWARCQALYYGNDAADAAHAGFADAMLYDEVKRPLHERRIPTERMHWRGGWRQLRHVAPKPLPGGLLTMQNMQEQQGRKICNIGLLGFGTVGRAFAEVLAASGHTDLRITHVFNRGVERKRGAAGAEFVPAGARWTELVEEVLRAPEVDIIVELIGGVYPLEDWVRTAIQRGKHVVTANKQLIAIRGGDLLPFAAQHGRQLLYNAAVAGGVPVIPGLVQGLGGDQISRVSGILNGTCNFMLSAMENGAEYADILREAQRLGYAEADPSADVDGYDARAKLCILARLAMGAQIKPESLPTQTISRVAAIDFAYARELGATVRQISRAERSAEGLRARVAPMLVPRTSPLALSHGTQNTVVTGGRFGGDVVFSGHGAGGHPTAVAVLSDVLAAAAGSVQLRPPAEPVEVSGDVHAPHYLRFVVRDEPGIVAAIAGALAAEHINIDAVLQRRGHTAESLPFVITTEPCLRSTLERAVGAMSRMSFMVEPPLALQILTVDDRETD